MNACAVNLGFCLVFSTLCLPLFGEDEPKITRRPRTDVPQTNAPVSPPATPTSPATVVTEPATPIAFGATPERMDAGDSNKSLNPSDQRRSLNDQGTLNDVPKGEAPVRNPLRDENVSATFQVPSQPIQATVPFNQPSFNQPSQPSFNQPHLNQGMQQPMLPMQGAVPSQGNVPAQGTVRNESTIRSNVPSQVSTPPTYQSEPKRANVVEPQRGLGSRGPIRVVKGSNASHAETSFAAGRAITSQGWKRAIPIAGFDDREATTRPTLVGTPLIRQIAPDESHQRPMLPLKDAQDPANADRVYPNQQSSNQSNQFDDPNRSARGNGLQSGPVVRYQSPTFAPPGQGQIFPQGGQAMPQGGQVMPGMGQNFQGSGQPPMGQQGVYPQGSAGQILPGQNNPGMLGTNGINNGIPSATNPRNLPTYQPRVVTGQPFVTEAPCQFDAYDMVHPANYAQAYPVCGGPSVFPGAPPPNASPYSYVPPTVTPDMAPGLYSPNNSGWRPLLTLGQENYNAQIGRGILGQPTAYVSGQPFRNFLRYIFP